ncbi:MAG: transcriptional regulator TetR family [Anaerosolibacter sp.]|jgi:AcrR family transcriptional regulator|uniref:TetR/AcrR family transcriptional regulator n=1 Tax=Anaerosolibacter sp. TaxID=1872527 RepID=UPI00260B6A7E|nr:TetR/AcrR family transcriptional regulator [Anaerosolibacter sp.]MDF2545291.1 transcriptional regulator TetR family [Anaerosolibacter sp.]
MSTQSMKKYNRLMEKAEELFFTMGYKRVTIDEIAAAAGISKMTIYKYFPSKEDLLIEVLIQISERALQPIMEKVDEIVSPAEKIEYIFSLGTNAARTIPVVLYRDILETPRVVEKLQDYKKNHMFSIWNKILQEGIDQGEIRPFDIEFMSHFLSDMAVHLDWTKLLSNSFYLNEEKGIGWLIENIYDFFKYGLLGKKNDKA